MDNVIVEISMREQFVHAGMNHTVVKQFACTNCSLVNDRAYLA